MADVEIEITDGVAIITIDRPEARNAIRMRTISELDETLTEADGSDANVLVILGGGDRSFVSGGDLKEFARIRETDEAVAMASAMRAVLDRLANFSLPVIAALNGHALGGGAEVAVAADMRVAVEDAKIGFTQAALGIIPAWGGIERLTELVGRSHALSLLCGATVLSSDEALAIGLIDARVPRERFAEEWQRRAQMFASLPAGRSRMIATIVEATRRNVHPQIAEAAVAAFAATWTSDEHWSALEALHPAETKT